MEFICPNCKRDILNRKVEKCLFCGAKLPQELLFSEDQIKAFEESRKRKTNYSSQNTVGLGDDISPGNFGDDF